MVYSIAWSIVPVSTSTKGNAMSPDYSTLHDMLEQGNMLREGHFSFRFGAHATALIDRDLLLADPATASRFGYAIAKRFFTDHVDTVATPSIWGAGLAQWVGYFLEPKARVVDATLVGNDLSIAEKLIPLVENKRVLLLDNLILSGKTMTRFLHIIRELNAVPVGVAALWSAGQTEIGGMPVTSVLNAIYPAYLPDDCPACAEGLPVQLAAY
jgi:orotate phosphoribosyltransferase